MAPASLCVTHTGGPGRPGFPSALRNMKGCLRWLDAVRMKGRRKPSRISAGSRPRVRTRKTVPGWKTPPVERRRAACPQRHAAPSSGADDDVAPFGAPRPHSREGQGKGRRQPRASPPEGPMNHACLLPETMRASAGCLTCESEMTRSRARRAACLCPAVTRLPAFAGPRDRRW